MQERNNTIKKYCNFQISKKKTIPDVCAICLTFLSLYIQRCTVLLYMLHMLKQSWVCLTETHVAARHHHHHHCWWSHRKRAAAGLSWGGRGDAKRGHPYSWYRLFFHLLIAKATCTLYCTCNETVLLPPPPMGHSPMCPFCPLAAKYW